MSETNNKNMQTAKEQNYPWYDDRAYDARSPYQTAQAAQDQSVSAYDTAAYEDEYGFDEENPFEKPENPYDTPKKIYDYLDGCVWKQSEAKKVAALLAYKTFVKGIRSNAMFIGPTGCGKTHTFRMLKQIFPNILIVNSSNITMDGWKGDHKFTDVFRDPIFYAKEPAIVVFDEFDKLMKPKYTKNDENVSRSIMSEMLKAIEGDTFLVKNGDLQYTIDTSNVSFVFCGAFSDKADAIAEEACEKTIGFQSSMSKKVDPYSQKLTEDDIIAYGCMPEFMGRIQRIVNLEPMVAEDYLRIFNSSCSPVAKLEHQYGLPIIVKKAARKRLAEHAIKSGLGIRGIENELGKLIDDFLFSDHLTARIEIS